MGFGDRGLGCRAQGFGFRVWGLGFGDEGLGFGVWGLGFGVWGSGFGVWGVFLPPEAFPARRWSTTLSSKVNLAQAIDFRALFVENLVTLRSKC